MRLTVKDNLEVIQTHIRKSCAKVGRSPADIHLIGVTKYVGVERTREAIRAGVSHLGENRAPGLQAKQEGLSDNHDTVSWHFIGTLQSRKVKDVIPTVHYIHSLDRLSLAKEIHKRAEQAVNCFVQVNMSGEASKHGLPPKDVQAFLESLTPYTNVKVIGLMTMAPYTHDEEYLRDLFRRLKVLQTAMADAGYEHAPCTELSMGMSNDYQIAVEEGATYIRIGSALVGNEG